MPFLLTTLSSAAHLSTKYQRLTHTMATSETPVIQW